MSKMENHWLDLSVQYANQRTYLDDLFRVYPTIPEGIRDIDSSRWGAVEEAFANGDDQSLLRALLRLDLFPIKDSYVAYLRRDQSSIERNPRTIARLASRVKEMGLNEVYRECSKPKETNRQIGPMFKRWCHSGVLGFPSLPIAEFGNSSEDCLLNGSDAEMLGFAKQQLGYAHSKGLDFVARISGQYFIGEAKFLTDFGGHQNAQLNDALSTLDASSSATHLAILDGVLFIPGRNGMFQKITNPPYGSKNIMSTLVLREFLHAQ